MAQGDRAAGLDKQAAIIASVLPLTSVRKPKSCAAGRAARSATTSSNACAAATRTQAGVAIAAEVAGKAKTMAGYAASTSTARAVNRWPQR